MNKYRKFSLSLLRSSAMIAGLFAVSSDAYADDVPIIQPGPPGADSREISADQAIDIAKNSYSPDDLQFMQDMIPHHNQAVEMSALVADRTNNEALNDIAGRITASQKDEIAFMEGWLNERGVEGPEPDQYAQMQTSHVMAGIASAEQMGELANAEGVDFERLYLELMIAHHKGAVKMVDHLLDQPGSAYDPILFEFTNDVVNDQEAEIGRMNVVLASLSNDPRVGLSAGLLDAGEAIMNLERVASLPKPDGFFDPENPSGTPPELSKNEENVAEDKDAEAGEPQWSERSPMLSFSNSDMAFSGDKLVTGSYHGFNIYQLGENGIPEHLSSIVCPGGQGDVSIVGHLLIMSVEQTRGRVDCGRQGVNEEISPDRFRGIRVFDISDMRRPVQVGQVQTCRGSHTHSVVKGPGEDGTIVVYNSGTSSVRDEEELEGCVGAIPGDNRTALFRIDVIEIPVADPAQARIVASPAVFADEETGRLAGLWQGGDHGEGTQETSQTNQCHDITVFPKANLAAGACSGNGIIFDITNPYKPRRIDVVTDPGFAYWHSATFNNEGSKVLFTDEWGGGRRPRCRAHDPKTWGADAIYNVVAGKLEFQSYYKLPAPQTDEENCVAHNGSIIPVPGRDIFAQAWYQGGLSIIDFTDSTNPVEIAYFDRGPINPDVKIQGGYWSTYWYQGLIYGTEIARGLDVFALKPSDYLTENEIAAAALAEQGGIFNPQQQYEVTWPDAPVVALAYVDQMRRDGALDGLVLSDITAALTEAGMVLENGTPNSGLSERLTVLSDSLATETLEGQSMKRAQALLETMKRIAAELQ